MTTERMNEYYKIVNDPHLLFNIVKEYKDKFNSSVEYQVLKVSVKKSLWIFYKRQPAYWAKSDSQIRHYEQLTYNYFKNRYLGSFSNTLSVTGLLEVIDQVVLCDPKDSILLLNLPKREINALYRHKIRTIEEVKAAELLKIHGIGVVSVNKILQAVLDFEQAFDQRK